MAKFTIYSPEGAALYTGTPSFTGQYMKPGLLEFREVALPAYVELVPGCYVDYTRVTDSLGGSDVARRYRIYTVPQLKKQARSYSYGAAYLYQSVQLYDASKMLEYCPFRDLVAGDNRIHFSTQPSISTFEGCDGLARRFEACLQDQYGADSWVVRVATQEENPALYELMREPRNFTVSGLNILECLNKVYEIWPEVGWMYKVEMVDGNPTDTIVIGGGGINPNQGTYAYGKGNGLTSLTRTAANADEIANRIYAYGSSRNMTLPSWYRDKPIKNAGSVDIQNIMIPISSWGLTDGQRDPAKAYVEDDDSIEKNGLRPTTVYFDGKGEYPEIYPTIREATIGMVRTALGSSSAQYYPSTSVYPNASTRVDKLLWAQTSFDSGKAAEDGKSATFTEYISVADNLTQTVEPDTQRITQTIITEDITFGSSEEGVRNISLLFSLSGYVQLYGITGARVYAHLHKGHPANAPVAKGQAELSRDTSNPDRYNFGSLSVSGTKVEITDGTYYIVVDLEVDLTVSATELTFAYDYDGTITASLSNYRSKTFNISLRQVGFDIGERADLGDGKTIAMRSGDCVGRSFAIKSVQYNSSADCWDLECWRTEDESLSQWFPNSQFGVAAEDEFVLLDIAMPDIYIGMASERLLTAAQELLADTAVERWQYTPEIDAKFMVENNRTIRAGEYMTILDIVAGDITPGIVSYFKTSGGGYLLTANGERIVVGENEGSVVTVFVDTVVINEGESVIPTYKVTLRDRKKKTWTESQSPESPSSKSVGSMESSTQQSSSGSGDSYFTLDESGNVTLKSPYQNLWVPGWLAAGGIGDGSGGGGGGGGETNLAAVWASLTKTPPLDEFANTKIHIDHIPLSDLDTWVSQKGYLTISDLPDSYFTLDGNGNVTLKSPYQNFWVPGWMAAGGVGSGSGGGGGGTVTGVMMNGVTYSPVGGIVDLGTVLTSFTETDPTVPSWAKQTAPYLFIGTTQVQQSPTPQDLTGILSINATSASDSGSRIVWESANNAWHFHGNLYADGWVAAGGIGSGGGSYTPGTGIDITNNVISLQTASTSALGGVKVDGTTITISNGVISAVGGGSGGVQQIKVGTTTVSPDTNGLATITNPVTTLISGWFSENFNITRLLSSGTAIATVQMGNTQFNLYAPSGGGISSVSLASGTNNGTLKLTVDGSVTDNIAVKGLGSLAYKSSLSASDIPSLNYLPLSGGELTGDLRLKGNTNYGRKLRFGDGDYAYLYEDSDDHLTIFADKGITLSANTSYGVEAGNYIDIGNARLVFDSGTNALHITKKSGTQATIGLYADGFVAAGGISGQTTSSYVDLESNQTVGGNKTFTGTTTFNAAINGLTITKSTNYVSLNNETSSKHLVLGSGSGCVFIGPYPSTTSYKFYVNGGDVRFTDNAYASSWNTLSDRQLKDNITELSKDEAIETIMALTPSTWEWNSGVNKGLTAAGFVAQDVESVIPFMVSGHEYKSLAYQMLHAYEVSAIQSHEARIKVLENKILEG